MNTSVTEPLLLSSHWYRVANLRPRLRGHIESKRQSRRGEVWHLLINPANHRVHRINCTAYGFIGRCDGKLTSQQIWDALFATDADAVPAQDEIIGILGRLFDADLIQFDVIPDLAMIHARGSSARHGERKVRLNPLAFRVPLFDPTALLRRMGFVLNDSIVAVILALGIALIALALPLALANLGWLRAHAETWLGTPRYIVAMCLAYPVMKACHELAHALAIRRWGGEVRQVGIALLMLMPVPYVDARAASSFRSARHRALVSAAGIFVELVLAALALLAWLNLQPGWLADLSFAIFFIGAFSSLIVNGNPLLRFDGYHVLCDALALPNLALRSAAWWAAKLRKSAGIVAPGIHPARGELPWLVAFAPLSLVYRIWLSLLLIGWLGGIHLLLGLGVAAVVVYGLLIKPFVSFVAGIRFDGYLCITPWRRWLAVSAPLIMMAIPVPFTTTAQGLTWVPEHATARAESDGFLAELPVADGNRVTAGTVLARLDNEDLRVERDRAAGQLLAQQTNMFAQAQRVSPERVRELTEAMQSTRNELEVLDRRLSGLTVTARGDGHLVMPRQSDRLGALVTRGESLGYVLDPTAPLLIRVALPHEQALLVRERTRKIAVLLPEDPFTTWTARADGEMSGATRELPGAALGVTSGGVVVTDPADSRHLKSWEPVVWMDVVIPDLPSTRIGTRVEVRFDHGWAPLAMQIGRRAQQVLLSHFNPVE